MHRILCCSFVLFALAMLTANLKAEQVDVDSLVQRIRNVGPKAAGHRGAITAMRELNRADVSQLPQILSGMRGAGPLQVNWLRGAAEAVAQRQLENGGKLPIAALERFLKDQQNAPRARRLAYELIRQVDKSAERRLVSSMLNDPSLELRRDAVELVTKSGDAQVKTDKREATASYRKALTSARDIDQIKSLTKKLRDLEAEVNLPRHFGFVMRWKLIGPFDNTDKKGFDVAYDPEKDQNTTGQYKGKVGQVAWYDHTTEGEYGIVDLNKAPKKYMGAIAYAYSEFISDKEQEIDLRLGCINANKVWLNGKLLTANHVYHANTSIDQYIGKGRLKKGKNIILLKICQNEQEDSWAQRWQFQLRVCDQYGTAVLSQDRPAAGKDKT